MLILNPIRNILRGNDYLSEKAQLFSQRGKILNLVFFMYEFTEEFMFTTPPPAGSFCYSQVGDASA